MVRRQPHAAFELFDNLAQSRSKFVRVIEIADAPVFDPHADIIQSRLNLLVPAEVIVGPDGLIQRGGAYFRPAYSNTVASNFSQPHRRSILHPRVAPVCAAP